MSTTTNFKRIALVAVAALGLGVLSSVPSQATGEGWAVTGSAGTATTTLSDSTTAGTFSVSFLQRAAEDSVTIVSIKIKSDPGVGTAYPVLQFADTSLAKVDTDNSTLAWVGYAPNAQAESITSLTTTKWYVRAADTGTVNQRVSASFKVYLNGTVAAGTYVSTITVATDERDALGAAVFKTQDVTITVTAASTKATAGSSYAYLTTGATAVATSAVTGLTPVDSTVSVTATASNTAKAAIRVLLGNSTSTAMESVTVTTTIGKIGNGTTSGKSVVMAYPVAGTGLEVLIYSDGASGTATVGVSTPSLTFANKSVTFYSTTPAKITAASYASVIGSSGIGVYGIEYDALNNSFGAGVDIYAYSSDTAVISNYGTACTYVSASAPVATCTLTGLKNGTANITLRDAATVADATVASNAVDVRVSLDAISSVKISFDKASYAPGEKATILVKAYDAAGLILPAVTSATLFSSTGITTSSNLTAIAGNTLATAALTTGANPLAATAAAPVVTTDPAAQYSYFMPVNGGTVTLTAKGGSSVALAGQVAITATATVTDNAAAALAAVTALATTVASLKTLITTLTNLVLKIQKKVKA
jgi:hypothetical protein